MRIELDGMELTMNGAPKGKESLEILGGQPNPPLSQFLFSQLGLMHLVAPCLPDAIETNFLVSPEMRNLIDAMYASEDHPLPRFKKSKMNATTSSFVVPKTSPRKAVVAFSAGKDSLWNVWWAEETYGKGNVLLVHIDGLNKGNAKQERLATESQACQLGFEKLKIVHLRNNCRNNGHRTMVSRDMFMMVPSIPYALEVGASTIITEGFAESDADELFTGQEENMRLFNRTLRGLGIPVQVAWRNRDEAGVIGDLIEHRPRWVSLICNCFMPPHWRAGHRKLWEKRTPQFPLDPYSCGVCPKCKRLLLARIAGSDPMLKHVPREQVMKFLALIMGWMRNKRSWRYADTITPSFIKDMQTACERYGLMAEFRKSHERYLQSAT